MQRPLAYTATGDADGSRLYVVRAREKLLECGLANPGFADDTDDGGGLNAKSEAVEDDRAVAISETYLLEVNGDVFRNRNLQRIGVGEDRGTLFHQVGDTAGGFDTFEQSVEDGSVGPEGADQLLSKRIKVHHHRRVQPARLILPEPHTLADAACDREHCVA